MLEGYPLRLPTNGYGSAMAEWSPEQVVDEPLARRLIGSQFPQLAGAAIEPLGEGWDSTVWLVDGRWSFRFPRREVVVPGLEREIAVLPLLAPLLPAPIPVPELVGRPADGYPFPFAGARYLPGGEPFQARPGDAERIALAAPIARFLRALHSVDPAPIPARRICRWTQTAARTCPIASS